MNPANRLPVQNIWGNVNEAVWLRRAFRLEKAPKHAVLRIYVDTGYELFINGRFFVAVDEWCNTRDYDVAAMLKAGENLIAVHGINHAGHRGCACELLADDFDLVSDRSWKAADASLWGWQLPEYDDSAWAAAQERDFSCAGTPQWSTLPGSNPAKIVPHLACSAFFLGNIPKVVDSPFFRVKKPQETIPAAVTAILGEAYEKSRADFPSPLLSGAKTVDVLSENGTIVQQKEAFTISAPNRMVGPSVILDFGIETVGFLRFRTDSAKPVNFRIIYAETLDECYQTPTRQMLLYRMVTEEGEEFPGPQEFESRNRNGFRYARIEFFECAAPVQLDGFGVRTSLYQTSYRGFFDSSDAQLNDFWQASRRTLHYCMQEYYLDGIKRDRFLWAGDARAEALFNYYFFGDTELFRFCWDEFAKVQFPSGAIPSVHGQGCSIIWDYVAWYVIAFHDYYLFTGDRDFLVAHKETIDRATMWLVSKAGENHLIDVPANPVAPLWMVTLYNTPGYAPLLNETYLRSLETAQEAAELADDAAMARKYADLSAATAPAVKALLAANPLEKDKANHNNSTGAFEVFEQLSREGRIHDMLDWIRFKWGEFHRAGGDTYFEGLYEDHFDDLGVHHPGKPAPYISYCHGWTASPGSVLMSEVAGIKPTRPGFVEFECRPQPDTLSWFSAACPTPHGLIAVKWENKKLAIVVPEGTTAKVTLPGETAPRAVSAGSWILGNNNQMEALA